MESDRRLKRRNFDQRGWLLLESHFIPQRSAEPFERDLHHVSVLQGELAETEGARAEEVNVYVPGSRCAAYLK